MNIGKITELCEKYIIIIDPNQNNLLENINELSNPKFSISIPNYTFHFKLVKNEKNIYQVQCLNTFKILVVKEDGSVYFEEYLQLKKIQPSLFYVVYDSISISLFSLARSNTILYFNERLSLKSMDEPFSNDDQTIFEYEQIDYSNLVVITNQPSLYLGIRIMETNNIKELFYNILNIYHNTPEQLLISLGNRLFPLDYYIENENWIFVDRYFNINNLKTYKRKLNLDELNTIEIIPSDENSWLEIDSVVNNIPKISSTQMIWHKIINGNVNNPVYFSTLTTFSVRGSVIKSRPFKYFNDIYLLLDKSNDVKIHNLLIYALYTIFFCVENNE
jgi:hypothetical protein